MPRRSFYGPLFWAFPIYSVISQLSSQEETASSFQSLGHWYTGRLGHKHRKRDASLSHQTLEWDPQCTFSPGLWHQVGSRREYLDAKSGGHDFSMSYKKEHIFPSFLPGWIGLLGVTPCLDPRKETSLSCPEHMLYVTSTNPSCM